jgi:prolyl oligopeptidase
MSSRLRRAVTSLFAVLAIGWAGATAAEVPADPYLWLEDSHGAKALAWVREQNQVVLDRLKSDPAYEKDYDALLAILDAGDRIPMGGLQGNWVFNFWQDSDHVRGIWRRTTVASYESAMAQWESLLDIDRLANEEGKDWVFKHASCAPDLTRCLIALSPGGGDTVVLREFDPDSKRFLGTDGFSLGEAKAEAVYIDADTILFSTDFGEGTLTAAGYPRIVKLWRRGEPVAAAKTIFEGDTKDVVVSPAALYGPDGTTALVERGVSFFENEHYYVAPDGSTVKLPIPASADIKGEHAGSLIATLRKPWTLQGAAPIAEGSLIGFPLKEFLVTRTMPKVAVLYTPGPRDSIADVRVGADGVFASIYRNVVGTVHEFRPQARGVWSDRVLDLPAGGSTAIVSANAFGAGAYFTEEGFLTPTGLYGLRDGDAVALKQLPARFDASPYETVQYEAISKDGTQIPYFVVRASKATGPQPMLLYGYGGFEISMTPFYWSSAGKLWLSRGGAYAVANIRGGGEFGPAWHRAAVKENRQKAFDDFIAVAEDMIRRNLTTTKHLGIMGGSNGGLLVGAVAVERPDLFGAVVCQVPLLDMLRYTKLGAGASWIAEYGDPANPEERANLLRYSPYQNVKADVRYPPMFFITATSDDRVTPAHARKMAAKMEAQGHDVLFYENTDGGHAAAANHAQQAEMNALTYVYLAQELGLN